MPYTTRQQLEDIWGETFVSEVLPSDVDADVAIGRALQQASDEIDVHLSARYTLPLATLPAALVTPCANIAVYTLANRHSALTQTIEDRYKQTVDLLQRIADGKAGLGADEPRVGAGGEENASSGGSFFTANDRVFSRRTLP